MTLHEIQRPATRVPHYVKPSTAAAVIELLEQHREQARLIAGGTDLIVELDRGAHRSVELLIDVSGIAELAGISETDDDQIRLGAGVTHNQVVASEPCRDRLLPLAQACLEVGSPQLRNRATVVGNVVTASPANDTISALLALGASVELTSAGGVRSVAIADFFTGFRATVLEPNELVTALIVPGLGEKQRGVFVKAGLRRAQAISVVHMAVIVGFDDDGAVTEARAALGSVAPTVIEVPDLAATLIGGPLDEPAVARGRDLAIAAASPIDDLRATAEYRASIVGTMMERALRVLADDRQRERWPTDPPLLGGVAVGTSSPAANTAADDDTDHHVGDRSVAAPPVLDRGSVITAAVNGAEVAAAGAVGRTLLDWLREQPGLRGVKEGCAEGECGACTVLLDGRAVMGCLTPAARADGATVVTVEGLATDGMLAPIQDAFIRTGAVQCGFCTPGFLVSCAALLDEKPTPTPEQVRLGLSGNLCRCTGYKAIESAVAVAVAAGGDGDRDGAGKDGS
ncbi:MAG: FAD binding domain-containing protein [Acidimicrobiia bacterium]|nr:FAD binding domain-containing protein [Acidimicrobiia bacterium]